MPINSKRKGDEGEREFSNLMRDKYDIRITRNLQQTRQGGHDLDGLPGIALEVKKRRVITQAKIRGFWKQARRQADDVGKEPALAYRGDREKWRVLVDMGYFHNNASGILADLSVQGFLHFLGYCLTSSGERK